jgi:hypothetical protein
MWETEFKYHDKPFLQPIYISGFKNQGVGKYGPFAMIAHSNLENGLTL